MKRRIFLLLLILVLLLAACGKDPIRTVEYRGMTFTLDTENHTITQGNTVCQYEINGDTYTITYPDGATYYMSWSGYIGTGGGNSQYHDSGRTDGNLLIDLLRSQQPKRGNPENFLRGLICIAFGIFNIAAPYASWYIGYGWRFDNAEPSDAYLTVLRIGGIVLTAFGIILLFI